MRKAKHSIIGGIILFPILFVVWVTPVCADNIVAKLTLHAYGTTSNPFSAGDLGHTFLSIKNTTNSTLNKVTVTNSYTYTYAYNINDFGKFKVWKGKYTVTINPMPSNRIKLIYKLNGKVTETAIARKKTGNTYTYIPQRGLYPGYVQEVIWNKKKKQFIFQGFEVGKGYFFYNPGIKNISKATVSGLNPQYTYTGKKITPSVMVSVDGITLKKDTDYSLSYKNNKNVGTATISIKGKGKYTGTKNLTFTIVKIILQNQTIKVNSSFLKSYSANGTFKLNATAKGKLSYKSSNTKVVTVSSKGVVTIKGTGNAVITVKAGKVLNKYNAASKNVKIKIVLKNKNMYVQPYKGVSLKSKASLTGKKVTAIPYAGAVEVKSYSNGWAYVTYKGKKGYIQEKNLGDVKPVPASSDKLLTQYSNQMSYRLVDFTKKFSKNAYRSNVTATSTEQLKKLGNMINVYASSQIIEKDKKEILEAFADAVLQAILNSNINKYETNQKKMLDQISSQIKGGLKSGSKKVTVSSGKTYTVDFNIAAQSYGGIGATVSWAYVTYGSQRYTLVISSTSEQIDAVLASYCTALAQLNTDCWKDFMSAYITGGWKLSGLNANYKLTDQKVRTYLDRSELLIRAIAGDEKAKTKLLESGSKDMKNKLKDMSNSAFRKYIKEHTKNGDKVLKAADKYKELSSKYKDWKDKYNTWKKSGKGTDLEKAEAACTQFEEVLKELNSAISSM